ncbi:bifunctional serine/threonine-protein kinase/ABC transporter substrate-binding protein [Streptomyces sp. NPDC018031]|uniref:bifunctional serine/threonine-protein kinase/ABC transporter substrate-binding protein n=1 Tax=Streptomyces sp. NPDC018031 TaxID=3365033 RepID=UPI0037B3FA1E
MQPPHPTDPVQISEYRILGRLGAGGMGMVLLGRAPSGTLVAIKVIRAEYTDDPGFRVRFRREVAAARRVRSRWAVPVLDADPEASAPWLATEFVPGPALGEAVGEHGPLPERGVRALGGMLAEALETVHAAGLVHRDVKPGNVLLALDGPRLIDFGIARALDDTVLTATDVVIGSPGFLSPEQAQGSRAIRSPSDVFSLGCLLAYAASGERPFGSGPVEALLFRTVHYPADLSGVPGALRPVIEACLEKDPARRPTADRLRREWATDAAGPGWLPAPVTHLIARRTQSMLEWPPYEALGAAPEGATVPLRDRVPPASASGVPLRDRVPPPPPPRPAPRGTVGPAPPARRRFLFASGSLLLAAGGGVAFWRFGPSGGSGEKTSEDPPRRPVLAVGLQADLSGGGSPVGAAHERGARLAVEHLNAREGDVPFDFELRIVDDRGQEAASRAAARKLIGDRRVVAVLGATSTVAAEAVMTAYGEAGLGLMSVWDGDITRLNRAFLAARPNNAYHMFPLLKFLGDRRIARCALVDDGTTYGWQVTRGLSPALRDGAVDYIPTVIPAATTDYGPPVRSLTGQNPDAIIYGGSWPDGARFARSLRKARYDGLVLGTQALHDPRFLREAGDAAEGWLLVSTVIDATAPAAGPRARAFARDFRTRFGTAPAPYAAEAYDAVRLLARHVDGLDRERVTREDVLPVLRKGRYDGVSKTYMFNEADGVFRGDGTFFYQVRGGAFRFLGTEGPATG